MVKGLKNNLLHSTPHSLLLGYLGQHQLEKFQIGLGEEEGEGVRREEGEGVVMRGEGEGVRRGGGEASLLFSALVAMGKR